MTSALGNLKYIGSAFFNIIPSLKEEYFRMQTKHTISHNTRKMIGQFLEFVNAR
jgi:hypothetical protein